MGTEITGPFNSVYQDGPTSDRYEPPKSRIRDEIGGTLQALYDQLMASIANLTGLIGSSVQWKDPVRVATTTNINLAAALISGATIDGVTVATGNRVLVKNQTAPAQNGIYLVAASGAASRVTDADAASEFVGLAVFVSEGTAGAGKQFICTTSAPIVLGITAINFVQLSDQSALNGSLSALNSFMAAKRMIFLAGNRPIAYDPHTRTLNVPALYGQRSNGATWNLAPASGANVRKIVESSGNAQVVYVDVADIIANGSDSPTALKIDTTYPSTLSQGVDGNVILGHIYSRKFFPAANVLACPVVANQFGCTKNDNDLADLTYPDMAPVALTNSDAIAAGYTRGWSGSNGNGFYYGGRFKEPINRGFVFYRFMAECNADNAFGTVRALLVSPAITTGNVDMTPAIERTVNARYRVYYGVYRFTSVNEYIGMWAGSNVSDGSVRVFGLQFAVMPDELGYVMEGDAPRQASLVGPRLRALENNIVAGADISTSLIPKRLCFIKERGYPLFIDQMFPSKAGPYSVALASRPSDNSRPLDVKSTGAMIEIDPARVGPDIQCTITNRTTYQSTGWQMAIATTVKTLAQVAGLSPKTHWIGDSLGDWNGTAVQTFRRMRQITGVDPVFIGTMSLRDTVTPDALTVLGESRGGKEFADYIGEHTDAMVGFAAGTESTYSALTSSGKQAFNPYLREATVGDDPTKVFSGYIFDFPFYLSRFGLSVPDVVHLNLGTNDITQQTDADSLAQIQRGLNIMIPSIRAAGANIQILIAWNAIGYLSGDVRWNGEHRAGLKAVIKYIKDLADSKVTLLPIYATVSRESSHPWAIISTDPDTGVSAITIDDQIHYDKYGIADYGDVTAQFILALAA